ncbi:sensor histidine kinase [Thermostaphylospora chromogena]|uniref:histidine kinase n=1 Tax=Thermostaphylospora chromogena TaxID=35622 RepID=A0A1H1A9N0_9ACTN|nr:HAMP domain-containing sensor histidine kinase [Thermostaphylospora chromogena]SDQ36016.1 two-component system, OmpR family, sensor histidine kinase MprB [Thermostaphylospora chromogena]
MNALIRIPLRLRLALAAGVAAALSVIAVMSLAYVVACNRVEYTFGAGSTAFAAPPQRDVLDRVASMQRALGWPFIAVSVGGLVLAALLGWIAARTALHPVARLTRAAERIAETRDLRHRIGVDRDDELGSLARSFNTMLDALERSACAQRRLVADASHELRTPLTALRTNVELLLRADRLDPADRADLERAVINGFDELTALVSDVVELARDEEPVALVETVRLDHIVRHETERAAVHWPAVRFRHDLEPTVVRGVPDRLARAVANLLDNAGKYSPAGGEVEVRLSGGELTVRDHGTGIAPEDLPHIFDRFYRAPRARTRPGSGLGLAIVRQIVDSHGGTVGAHPAPGGGTLVRLSLPRDGREPRAVSQLLPAPEHVP